MLVQFQIKRRKIKTIITNLPQCKKLPGGALLYAILVSFIISVLSGCLILLNFYLQSQSQRFLIRSQLSDQLFSAIEVGLVNGNTKGLEFDDLNLYENEHETSLETRHWGNFNILYASSKYKTDSITKLALTGASECPFSDIALNILNTSHYLSVCGNVTINGNIHVPNSIINKTPINGRSVGNIIISNEKVSDIRENNEILELNPSDPLIWIDEILENEKYVYYDDIIANDTISNSFLKPTIYIYSSAPIYITNKVISGNVVFMSHSQIFIDSTNTTRDAIFVSDKITISGLKESCLQAFAFQTIEVHENSQLNYPSSLTLSNNSNFIGLISVQKSTINGSIILNCPISINSKIYISNSSSVQGLIYSTSFVEHKGSLTGSLQTFGLVYQTPFSTHENVLMDASIDKSGLSKSHVWPSIFANYSNQKVIRWLN